MNILLTVLKIFIFPGFLFLAIYALFIQWLDRKLYARMQNRVGPPWYQPFSDLMKLFSKETIVPQFVDKVFFHLLPYFSFASVVTAFLFIPVWSANALYQYPGDLVVVAYLLTIPTLVLALAGWISNTSYSIIGGIRCLSQLFSYEVPFFIAILIPGIILGTWNISEISTRLPSFLIANPIYFIPILFALVVGIISLQGKLERKPFDIPDAETELVAGPFVEYSGRLLAIFRFTIDMEMVVGVSLLSAIFLGGPQSVIGIPGFILYLIKALIIVFILSYIKSATARIRIDQMIYFGWRILAPISIVALLAVILLSKGAIR